MTSVKIFVEDIKRIFASKDKHAVGSYRLKDAAAIDISELAEFACSVSRDLDIENWFLCATNNYFVLEIDDKFIVVYFADDVPIDCGIEYVIRRCNSEEEYNLVISAIT